MAVPTGFEPAIFSLTGRYARPLHYGTMLLERSRSDRGPRNPTFAAKRWAGQDSNLRSPSGRQIYSLVVLATHPPTRALETGHPGC